MYAFLFCWSSMIENTSTSVMVWLTTSLFDTNSCNSVYRFLRSSASSNLSCLALVIIRLYNHSDSSRVFPFNTSLACRMFSK